MRSLQSCSHPWPYGTSSASFAVVAPSPTIKNIKNIPMFKCFGVFSQVIAFVCLGSEFATVRTLLSLLRRIGACTALARAKNVGKASLARLAPPTSRRGIIEPWELSLLRPRPEWFSDGHPKRLLGVDSTGQAETARRGEPVSCGIEEPLRYWNPRPAPIPAGKQTGQTTDPTRAEFVGAHRLLAGLVLHQVRPQDHSAAAARQRIGPSHNRNPGLVSVPGPDAGSSLPLRSQRSVTTASATSPDQLPASLETLFSQLARRRLRLAAKERP